MSYTENDRLKDTLETRPKDRVPVIAGTILWAASNFPHASYKEIVSDPDLITAAQLWAKDLLGFDLLYPTPDNCFISEAFGCRIRYTQTGPIVDALPLSLENTSEIENLHFPNPGEDGRFPMIREAAQKLLKESGGTVPIVANIEGPFTSLCRVIEVELVLRMMLKKPRIVDKLLDKMNQLLIEFAKALVETGVNCISLPEPTASATMISPRMFRKFVLPHIREFTNQLDVPVLLHICGDTTPILDAMGESGADILSLDQCMDLAKARTLVPEKVIAGNVDPVASLLMGDVKTVEQDARHCLKTMGTERFILMPGCGLPPDAPADNVKAMVRVAAEYGLGRQSPG